MTTQAPNQQSSPQIQSAGQLTETDLRHHSQELGTLGSFFGSKENAPSYIAAIAIILSFVMIGCVLFAAPDNDFPKSNAITLFGAIITGALGYLFGRRS